MLHVFTVAPFVVPQMPVQNMVPQMPVQDTLPQWTPEHIAAAMALQRPQLSSAADKLERNGEAAGMSLQHWLANENELANEAEPSLHKVFRAHSRAHRQKVIRSSSSDANVAMRTHKANASKCASSCKSVKHGRIKSFLYYDTSTRAGLSDRAWHISHLLALANALCARPVIRAPHELLSSSHNHHQPINKKWWWDRYLEGVGNLEHMSDNHPQGAGGCPWGKSKNVHIGPSSNEADITRDLKKAQTSRKPFSWCLKHNIRSYLGAGGFEDKSVPHEWCDMREPWLGGTEDMTSRRLGERALGPSHLVQTMAQNVTASLGISTFSRLAGAKCTNPAGKPVWCSTLSIDSSSSTEALPGTRGADYSKIMNEAQGAVDRPVLDETGSIVGADPVADPVPMGGSPFVAAWQSSQNTQNNEGVPVPCDGLYCGQCSSNYGDAKPCCGQDKRDPRANPDLRPCPEGVPTCVEYHYGRRYGRCTSVTLEKEREKQLESARRHAEMDPAAAVAQSDTVVLERDDGADPWETSEPGHWGEDGEWVSGDLDTTPEQTSPESLNQPANPWEKGEPGHWGEDGEWASGDIDTTPEQTSPESLEQPANPWEKGEAGHWGEDGKWVSEVDTVAVQAAPEAAQAAPLPAPEAQSSDRVSQRKVERKNADAEHDAERARIEHELQRNQAEKERARKHEKQRKRENDRRWKQTHSEHAERKQPQPTKAAKAHSDKAESASAEEPSDTLDRVAQRKVEHAQAATERDAERGRIDAEKERERTEEQAREKEVDNASQHELQRNQAEKERVRKHEQARKLENDRRRKQTQDDSRRTQTENQASKSSRQVRSRSNVTEHSSVASTVGMKWHVNEDESTWLYVLHIRRSDTKLQCDTTVEAVMKYMTCPAARSDEKSNHKLIFFTDETSPKYIDLLTDKLSALPRWGGGVIHGDAHVVRHLAPEDQHDNYLVYAVASLLMSHADELYEMERCQGKQTCDMMGVAQKAQLRVGHETQLRESKPPPAKLVLAAE